MRQLPLSPIPPLKKKQQHCAAKMGEYTNE